MKSCLNILRFCQNHLVFQVHLESFVDRSDLCSCQGVWFLAFPFCFLDCVPHFDEGDHRFFALSFWCRIRIFSLLINNDHINFLYFAVVHEANYYLSKFKNSFLFESTTFFAEYFLVMNCNFRPKVFLVLDSGHYKTSHLVHWSIFNFVYSANSCFLIGSLSFSVSSSITALAFFPLQKQGLKMELAALVSY
jgi:hypothetical protein